MKTEEIVTWVESLKPVISWEDMSESDAERLSELFDVLDNRSDLSESQAKRLYMSIFSPLDGLGSQMSDILSRVPGYPFEWQLWDTRDELDGNNLVRELKEYAFELGVNFDIAPLPTYNFNENPVRWLRESLQADLSSYELHKMFVYAVGNIGGTAVLAPRELHTDEGKRLLCLARAKVEAFEPRSDGLKYLRSSTLSILDDKINRLQVNRA